MRTDEDAHHLAAGTPYRVHPAEEEAHRADDAEDLVAQHVVFEACWDAR